MWFLSPDWALTDSKTVQAHLGQALVSPFHKCSQRYILTSQKENLGPELHLQTPILALFP